MTKRFNVGVAYIIAAGSFWGSMGIFVRKLGTYGFDPIQISALRLVSASICFLIMLIARGREGFRIRARDLPLFLGLGIGSVALMTCCYFAAIQQMTMSAAAVLLYTSPIWVMLMAVLFFHERVTWRKLLALLLSFAGCALVSGFGGAVRLTGILAGVAAGIAYALYSILGSIALKRYPPHVVSAHTFFIAAVSLLAIARPADMAQKVAAAEGVSGLLLLIFATGIVTAFVPFLLYTIGLRMVEASRAAILATVEPVVATVLGIALYRERMNLAAFLGIVGILAAIVILNTGRERT